MKKLLLALALAAAAPLAAHASEDNGIGYTYAQLDYVNVNFSGNAGYAQGAQLSGSYGFANNYQVFGSYGSLDVNRVSAYDPVFGHFYWHPKIKPWTLGFGYNASIGSRADWVTQLSYQHAKNSNHMCLDDYCIRYNSSNNVWAISTGVMGRVTDSLTANAYIGYDKIANGHADGQVFGQFGLVYSFTPMWALEGGVRVNNDATDTFNIGVRASF